MSNGEENATKDTLADGARMIDVGEKDVTHRVAKCECTVKMQPATLRAVLEGRMPKGDVLATARVAAVMAAKRTPSIVPLCHPLPLDCVNIEFETDPEGVIRIIATVAAHARTGVEMEALTACAAAALTIYDMCKMVERGIVISGLRLLSKSGGKTGDYKAE
jgi:cyclic pyranopterin phosphate synthase